MTTTPPDDSYSYWFAVAMIAVAKHLEESESNTKRKDSMGEVIKLKEDALRAAYPEPILCEVHPKDRKEAMLMCIDLAFCNPFAPYQLSYSENNMKKAVAAVVERWELRAFDIDAIFRDKPKALKTLTRIDYRNIALFGFGAAALLALTGAAAAPAIAAALGNAAGLSGVAAILYGLALLGGGSLAAGGAGMAGGLWLLAGVGATVGFIGGSGGAIAVGALLQTLSPGELKRELAKLLVTHFQVGRGRLSHLIKVEIQEGRERLKAEREELERNLEKERGLNDGNAPRVKNLEEKIWMINVTEKVLGIHSEQHDT